MKAAGTALVVGANRGIGLAITRALLEDSSFGCVFATFRENSGSGELDKIGDERLRVVAVDVTQDEDMQSLARAIDPRRGPDLVVHCAGILHEPGVMPEKALAQCDRHALMRLFSVNSIGPLMLARAILPLMPKRSTTHFAVLSAMVGSIGDNRLGGWYGYRASKAALNQFLRTLSIECRRTHPGLCITAIHPGTTDTALSAPFQAKVEAGKLYTPVQSARRILDVVRKGKPEDSGRFVNWDGSAIPW